MKKIDLIFREFTVAVSSAIIMLSGRPGFTEEVPKDTGSIPVEKTDEPPPPSTDTMLTECAPPCRVGYMCKDRRCVPPCNPPCQATEICTRNGLCIARSPAPVAQVRQVNTPVPRYSNEKWKQKDTTSYKAFEDKKKGGVAMMAIGGIAIVTAFGLGFVAGYNDESAFLWAGIGVELIGDVLFFTGLAKVIKGKRGMAAAKRKMARAALGRESRRGTWLANCSRLGVLGNGETLTTVLPGPKLSFSF